MDINNNMLQKIARKVMQSKPLVMIVEAVPFLLLVQVAWKCRNRCILAGTASSDYHIFFSVIVVAATLAALSFQASNSSSDPESKKAYLLIGERLFHATARFILSALFIHFFYQLTALSDSVHFRYVIGAVVALPGLAFLFFGLMDSVVALGWLRKTLFYRLEQKLESNLLG